MSCMKRSVAAVLLFGTSVLAAQAINELKTPPAPFAAGKIITAMPKISVKQMMKTHGTSGKPILNYSINCGDNSLQFRPDAPTIQYIKTGGRPRAVAGISYWGSSKAGYGHPFKGEAAKINYDKAANSITVTKKFYGSSVKTLDGLFTEKVTVLKDGLIDFKYGYKVVGTPQKIDNGLMFSFRPFKLVAGMKLLIDGKPYQISKDGAPYGNRDVFKGQASKIVFAPDRPTESFTLIFPKPIYFYIREKKQEKDRGNQWRYFVEMRVNPGKNGALNFKLDIRNTSGESVKKSNTFNGINFWQNDRLNVPNFAASRNLLPNPSFESGLRYYDNFFTWGQWPGKDYQIYSVDEQNAKFGNRCLRVTAWKDYPQPNYLTTFTVPTVPGKKYTFSFFSKAGGPRQRLDFTCVTAQWGKFPKWTGFNLSQNWKRYSVTFTAPNNAAVVMIKVRNFSGKAKVDTLVDGMQFEEGSKATAYVDKPFGSELITSDPDNFISLGRKINAKMRIQAGANQSGVVEYKVKDYFYNILCKGKLNFKAGNNGSALVQLPFDGKTGTGIFVVRADYTLDNGKKYTDFYRFSIIKPITEYFKFRKLFACGGGARTCNSEAVIQRAYKMGFGSNNYQTTKRENDLYAKYDIYNTGSGVISYGPRYSGGLGVRYKKLAKRVKEEGYSDELRDAIEQFSHDAAKANPWVDSWFLQGECNAGGGKFKVLRNRDNASFVKFILAGCAGVKRADPSKKLMLTGGPANMSPNGGIRDVDNWLGLVSKMQPDLKFDSISIHPYRPVPENPDLDDDTATFLKMLRKHGYDDVPIYWNEGIYHRAWNIAEWGLDPHKGCSTDHWRAGTPTYDMGWGERISAAYYARSWLVAMKYGDRIKQYNGWNGTVNAIDTQLTPLALQKIPNTLGHLLGNSTFKQDIRFAPNVRVYVFEDEKQRPVAALWSHIPMVDRGFERSPMAAMKFTGKLPEFFDLMGNRVKVRSGKNGAVRIPVTPFPLFIRSAPGTLPQLCAALKNARLSGSNEFALRVGMSLKSRTTAEISFTNRLSRHFVGEVKSSVSGQQIEHKLDLPERASESIKVKLKSPVSCDKITQISLPLELTEKGSGAIHRDLSIWTMAAVERKNAIVIDGNTDDWKTIPAIKLNNRKVFKNSGGTSNFPKPTSKIGGKDDLDAEYKLCWDHDYLYLCVNVIDDKPFFPALKSPSGDWTKDSIQVYIDTFGDNANRLTKSIFDFNDYNYDISVTEKTGKVNVFRRAVPEQQLAGGVDAPKANTVETGVKAAVKMTANGYVYEVAFPRPLVAPLVLKKNSFFRLGLIVNDNDGAGRKGGLTNLPAAGSVPYENPDQWPGVLLVK